MQLRDALRDATARLTRAGVPEAQFDARALAAHALGVPLAQLPLHYAQALSAREYQAFESLVSARARREPLQYLTGVSGFYGREFACDRRALIPRPDTETVVDVALELARMLGLTRIADLGTGCGIIAVTLAAELPGAQVLATDSSGEALTLAAENVARHGLADRVMVAQGTWAQAVVAAGWAEWVEMIVSNPPYVRADEVATLMPEVRDHEPREALMGPDADGLGAYRTILAGCRDLPGLRAVVFEVGAGQAAAVVELTRAALPVRELIVRKDLSKVDRAVAAVLETRQR
ncbi:MAG: peptide chain release factor N(5)-glutamine methyltransferase [Armatimonadota bacterium]